jgi:transposase
VLQHDHVPGNYNSESFASFVGSLPNDKTVIMDNVAFHRSKIVRAAAERKNISLVYIPPYSPWYNPVEYAFSIIKQNYRKLRLRHGTVAEHIEESLQSLTAEKSSRFYDHARNLFDSDVARHHSPESGEA